MNKHIYLPFDPGVVKMKHPLKMKHQLGSWTRVRGYTELVLPGAAISSECTYSVTVMVTERVRVRLFGVNAHLV